MTFRVGQEVAFVPRRGAKRFYNWGKGLGSYDIFLRRGEVLTITNISNDEDGCWLKFSTTGDNEFDALMFRPIVKTDISSLQEIARRITKNKRIDA